MFIQNKYTKWYLSIIKRSQLAQRTKKQDYFESHHIIPKSLGGSNQKTNLVLLTGREHFLCHLLLTKMLSKGSTERSKMLHAFMLLKGSNQQQKRYINSRLYENIKEEYATMRSIARKGKSLSQEQRSKISASLKGHSVSQETRTLLSVRASERKRKPFSEEYKQRHSEIMKQRHRWKTTVKLA